MSHQTARTRAMARRATGLTAFTLTAFALAACGGPSVGGTTSREDASADVDWSQIEPASEITWWSNHPGSSKAVEEELVRRFHEEHPEITVTLVTAGANYDEIAQRFQAASQTDEKPDVVISSDVWWFRYHLNDQIMPVDEIFEAIDGETDDFQPALYGDYEYDGKHWAVPYARSTPLFYYNTEMWEAAGLPDRGPETWKELQEWGAALEEQVPADGSPFGLSLGTSWSAWWFENMIWGEGGAYSDGFEVTLDSEHSLAGGEFLRDLFHGEDAIATVSSDDAMADLASGLIASTIGSTGSLKGALDAASFEVGTAFLPDGADGGGTPTGGTGLAISSSSTPEEQLASAMFLRFITNTENTAYFSQNTGYMPVRTSAVESAAMTETYAAIPQFRTAVDQLGEKARSQDYIRVFVPGADALLTDAIEQIVLEGTDPATAFESITPQIETAYTENVEPYL